MSGKDEPDSHGGRGGWGVTDLRITQILTKVAHIVFLLKQLPRDTTGVELRYRLRVGMKGKYIERVLYLAEE